MRHLRNPSIRYDISTIPMTNTTNDDNKASRRGKNKGKSGDCDDFSDSGLGRNDDLSRIMELNRIPRLSGDTFTDYVDKNETDIYNISTTLNGNHQNGAGGFGGAGHDNDNGPGGGYDEFAPYKSSRQGENFLHFDFYNKMYVTLFMRTLLLNVI